MHGLTDARSDQAQGTVDAYPLLVNETRNGVIESRHAGHVAVVDAQGNILQCFGDVGRVTFGRSALKPMQALPVIETGTADAFAFTDAEVALCCASHSGQEKHLAVVRRMLEKIGVSEAELVCGAKAPVNVQSYERMMARGESYMALCNECSGVHAGMIATAVHQGESVAGYAEPAHPVQRRVRAAVVDASGMVGGPEALQEGVDGCGIPTFAMPLWRLAWVYARMGRPHSFSPSRGAALVRIVDAMAVYPDLLTEEEAYCTKLMRAFDGRVIAKEGAKGLLCLCDRDRGIGIAVRIEDGAKEPLPAVINEVLQQMDMWSPRVARALCTYTRQEIQNAPMQSIGRMEPVFVLG